MNTQPVPKTMTTEQMTYVYRISPDDVIEFVNDAWIRFALENGAPSLTRIVGTSLWNYISGPQVVHLSRELLAKVRERRCEATVPFRCDSPWVRRFMRMSILPLPKGQVEFRTWIEREEPFTTPIQLLDSACPKDHEKLLRMCAWCKKIDVAGSWLEIVEAIHRLRLFDLPTVPAITHGICEGCLKMVTGELDQHLHDKSGGGR